MIGPIILQIVLIGLNAIFAGAEIAVISMNSVKLEKMAGKGDRRAKKLMKLTSQPAKFLATIQVAITLAGFLGSAYAADNFAAPLVRNLLAAGISIPEETLNSICVFVITIIIAFFSIVFGELIPKRIAMKKTEGIALAMSDSLALVSTAFRPLVWLLTFSTNSLLRIIGIDPEEEDSVTEEEIRMMIAAGSEKGVIQDEENEIIQNAFELGDTSLEEICTHRKDVITVDVEDDFGEWIDTIKNSHYSYLPVCKGNSDNIIGVLDTRKFYRLDINIKEISEETKQETMRKCMNKPYFVPENMDAASLCEKMKDGGRHFAIAIDEYGGMCGVVTAYDLFTLLMGEFISEGESHKINDIEKVDGNSWRIQGKTDLEDVAELFDIELPYDRYDTFGGYIMGQLGSIPEEGASLELQTPQLNIRIENVRDLKIESAIVSRKR